MEQDSVTAIQETAVRRCNAVGDVATGVEERSAASAHSKVRPFEILGPVKDDLIVILDTAGRLLQEGSRAHLLHVINASQTGSL